MTVDMISDRLGSYPLVLQLPIGIESNLKGVVDLVANKAIIWKDESLGAKFDIVEIPEDLIEESKKYREKLIEKVVEEDDTIMESYLEGTEPSIEELKKCIRSGTIKGNFVPVLTSSSILSLAITTSFDISSDISSKIGPICLHGPHHSAQKSTIVGFWDFITSVSKLSSVTFFVGIIYKYGFFEKCQLRSWVILF